MAGARHISHPATWIFRGNPDDFKIEDYLADVGPRISWVLRWHRRDVQVGDRVYIWQSLGRRRAPSGIVARAQVVSAPFTGVDRATLPYWKSKRGLDPNEVRIGLDLEEPVGRAADFLRISRDALLADAVGRDLRVLSGSRATNTFVEPHQAERLDELWTEARTRKTQAVKGGR